MEKVQQFLEYAQHIELHEKGLQWVNSTLKNYLEKHETNVPEVEHVLDYIAQNSIPGIMMMSYPQAVKKAEKWVIALQKQGEKIVESDQDTSMVLDFKDGFKIVQLKGKNAYVREGKLMHNCVASYFGRDTKIYSLRDSFNNPHATMEWGQQIKGKGNGSIDPKYIHYVVKFLEFTGMEVRDSEMLNLGYINVEKYKKYLSKDLNLFQGKYHYKQNPLIDKDGKEFMSFELWDQIPLVDERTLKLAVNFESVIKLSIDFLWKSGKKLLSKPKSDKDSAQIGSSGDSAQIGSSGYSAQIGSSGDSAQIGSSGDSAQIGSSGDYARIGSSGYSAQIGSSGDSAQIGSSGDYARIGSSGYYAQIGSSGDYAQIGSSGDYARIGSSGYSAQIGSSGYYAQIGSSGDYARIGSSGYSAQIGSSGYYAQIGSSGDSAQIESEGQHAVIAGIGYYAKIKAMKGSWITLAEYDSNGKPVCVKSAQIDGKKLKENVWYELKNKKFKETKI